MENNTFQRCVMDGILIGGDAVDWFESGPVRDVLIRGNTFIGCGILIAPHTRSGKPEEPVHENIRIIGNHFEGAGVSASGVKGLTVTGNRSTGEPIRIKLDPSRTANHVSDNSSKQ